MRSIRVLAVAVVVGLAAPAAGSAQSIERAFPARMPHRGECIKLTKQLIRYTGDLERARERDNELWEQATLDHMGRLDARRRRLCPQIVAQEDPFYRDLGRLLGIAAQAALKYFTFGAL